MGFISIVKTGPSESRKIRIYLIIILFFVFLTSYFSPAKLIRQFIPDLFNRESSCILLNVSGIPCPLCGFTRSFEEILKLNIAGSFYYNPSSVFIFTFLACLTLFIFVISFFNYKIKIVSADKTFLALTVVLVTVWIVNIFFGHH
ncbi:MAG TPA: DUF2752 domain-containing protein [Ignavibacteria bacterium]|nr:DUF2752 domain-containing protein [Ignavibacteria bacterium]HQY51702.1 DUF2752 domain-containing protein [Ignavibacteria bacterium]HRA99507.1 DUF2752 domain-containing protein [Ignavibacteria bacterium]